MCLGTGPSAPAPSRRVDAPAPFRVRRIEGAPVCALRLWLPGGCRNETVPGQAAVTGRMLSEGTAGKSWKQLAVELEERGASLSSFGTAESHGLMLDGLAHDWQWILELAAELLFESSFPEERCRWLRDQAGAELDSLADQPDVVTAWAFMDQLYRPHPACRPVLGTRDGLNRLRAADCRRFHRRAVERGGLLSVAGEIDEDAVSRRVLELFAPVLSCDRQEAEHMPPEPVGGEPRREVDAGSGEQAHLFLGHLTVARSHDDVPALEALAVTLGAGSGLAGRIPNRIREREGLAYTAQAHTVSGAGRDPGRLVVYIGTSPDTVDRAEALAREELERFVADGVTDQELADARSYLLGREPFVRETARQWADLLCEALYFGLPLDDDDYLASRLATLDRERVNEVARRHLDPAALKVSVGLPTPS